MNIPEIPVDWTPYLERANEPFTLSIVIVYNNMRAALRAALMVERLGKKFHGKMEPRLQPLPLEHLHDSAKFDRALSDASGADMIIVSLSGPGALPTALQQWITDCTAQKREGDSAVVALLGTMDETEAPDSDRLQFLKKATRGRGRDFFAPQSDREVDAIYSAFAMAS
jgi:hypothetical protein